MFELRPDNCELLTKLRSPTYFNIAKSEISDNQLLAYINKHEHLISSQVLEIEYGLQVSSFLNRGRVDSNVERQFYNSIGDAADFYLLFLEAVLDILATINESPARIAVAQSLSVFSEILEGYKTYRLALNVITTPNTRVILDRYIRDRGSQSKESTWQGILQDFAEPIELIRRGKQLSTDNLANWFEEAFLAHRLATSENLRRAKGIAIARVALAE